MLLVIVKANLYGDNSFTTNGNFLVSNYGVKYNLLLTVNNIEILFKFKCGAEYGRADGFVEFRLAARPDASARFRHRNIFQTNRLYRQYIAEGDSRPLSAVHGRHGEANGRGGDIQANGHGARFVGESISVAVSAR